MKDQDPGFPESELGKWPSGEPRKRFPEPLWLQRPAPTSGRYVSAKARRGLAWAVLVVSALLTGAGLAWWLGWSA
jgi:hypothetical protein